MLPNLVKNIIKIGLQLDFSVFILEALSYYYSFRVLGDPRIATANVNKYLFFFSSLLSL